MVNLLKLTKEQTVWFAARHAPPRPELLILACCQKKNCVEWHFWGTMSRAQFDTIPDLLSHVRQKWGFAQAILVDVYKISCRQK